MNTIRSMAGRIKRGLSLRGTPRSKEELAAAFFIKNFGHLSRHEMDSLVRRYWSEYRRFEEMLVRTGMSTSDPQLHLLDIGGGFSTGLRLFETSYRWVLDICVDELYRAGMNMPSDIRFIRGEGERIPFPADFFDTVFCTNVLDHVEDPKRVLAETHRVLRPGGYLILMVDLFDEGAEHSAHDPLHPHTLHADTIEEVLREKFRIEERATQPGDGKVGLGMLARGVIDPHPDRQEHIFVLRPV